MRIGPSIGIPGDAAASGGFSPAMLGPALWLRADIGFTASTGVWLDQSGNGKDTTPQSATRPTAATGINGKATVLFPGSANQALVTGSLSLGAHTIAMTVKFSGTNGYAAVHVNGGAADGGYMYTDLTSSILVRRSATNSSKNVSGSWLRTGVPQSVIWTYNGTQATNLVYLSNVLQSTTDVAANDVGTASVAGALYIAADQAGTTPATGDIGEVIVYSRALSATERSALAAYQLAFWGV